MKDSDKPATDAPNEALIQNALRVRQFAIGLIVEAERLCESLNHPVESAVVTRRDRRQNHNS